jgi:hypothetical protein
MKTTPRCVPPSPDLNDERELVIETKRGTRAQARVRQNSPGRSLGNKVQG